MEFDVDQARPKHALITDTDSRDTPPWKIYWLSEITIIYWIIEYLFHHHLERAYSDTALQPAEQPKWQQRLELPKPQQKYS